MKSALVTGASRGIGRAIATELAARGYALTVTSRTQSALRPLAEILRGHGSPHVEWHAADLADRDATTALAQRHRDAYGSATALILAGGVGTAGPIETLPLHRIDKTFAVNVTSAIALIQKMLPLMRAGARAEMPGSRVIALASITGVHAEPGLAAYGASKAALMSFIAALNAEESKNGVMATAVAPAYVHTDMSAWVSDAIPPATMLQTADIVTVVKMLLDLGRTASVTEVVMSRSGASAYRA